MTERDTKLKITDKPAIAYSTCYKLAAVNYRKTQIEALNKRIKKKKGWK